MHCEPKGNGGYIFLMGSLNCRCTRYSIGMAVVSAGFITSSAEIIFAYGGTQVVQFQLVNKPVNAWDHCKLFFFSFAGRLKGSSNRDRAGALERCRQLSAVAYVFDGNFITKVGIRTVEMARVELMLGGRL